MKKICLLLLLPAFILSHGQNAKVKLKSVAIDSMSYDTTSIYTLKLEVKKPKVTTDRKIRLADVTIAANGQSNLGWNRNNADDYFDSDHFKDEDKNTFPLILWPTDTIIRKLDTIRGKLHYFEPTRGNGGIRSIADPLSKVGQNLVEGIIDDAKVIMIPIETLMRHGNNYEKEVRALEESNGLSPGTMKEGLDQIMADPPGGSTKNLFLYFITGNPEKIAKIDFFDSTKSRVFQLNSFGVRKRDGFHIRYISYKEAPAADWKMDIYMETEASVTKHDFILTNVRIW